MKTDLIKDINPTQQGLIFPIIHALKERGRRIGVSGLFGSSKAYLLSALAGILDETAMVIVPTQEEGETLFKDMAFFFNLQSIPMDRLAFFPQWEILPYEEISPHIEIISTRIRTLVSLLGEGPKIVIAPITSAMQKVMPKGSLSSSIISIRSSEEIDREELIKRLSNIGYSQVPLVENRGEFAVRGGIIDIYSTLDNGPVRIELLGDIVESIRIFDPSTQRSVSGVKEAVILPARDTVKGTDFSSLKMAGQMETIFDYLPADYLLISDEPMELEKSGSEFDREIADRYLSLSGSSCIPDPSILYLPSERILDLIKEREGIDIYLFPTAHPDNQSMIDYQVTLPGSLGMGLKGTAISASIAKIGQLRENDLVLFVARSKGQGERLLELLGDEGVPATHVSHLMPNTGEGLPVYITVGDLSSGFIMPGVNISFITEDEIFGKGIRLRRPDRNKKGSFISSLEDLRPHDLIVHNHHGIGRYIGLKRLAVDGYESDFIIIEYAGGDRLYHPIDRLDVIQRYTGIEGHQPAIDRLGGTSWIRIKERVKRRIKEMTGDLLKLYAAREVMDGFSFSKDSYLSGEFDTSFEYEETDDQLRAIEDVKRDMELAKPMDRIVCGDVGYGKTEVAMRAAFKAVVDSNQVAILVPTTLLAEQHYHTFKKRFSPFPVRIEMLSRFRSKKDQMDIVKKVGAGEIDILIGTHRLIQKDVRFYDLGLLIIDEEQRFGVADKERLKHLKKNVDVLTLTATPIPRTLQMSLMGVRDLSIIDTPPQDRLSIRTITSRFDKKIIRDAILRELSRGGQVFFVHNRIGSIGKMASLLSEVVPEARIATVHGQMNERRLEDLMMGFIAKEYDLLLTTTIIESGLDIPSANTIIINRADKFGLSELYQLRGRVGRSGHQAYAYLLLPDNSKGVTDEARKRIEAIVEFSQLGSGFKIAARDLEIRGAGEILGREQSGWLAAIGFELYLKMVEDCVKEFKGIEMEEEVDPLLNLSVSAYIPEDYMPDSSQRLVIYKRLSSSKEMSELYDLRFEIEDRFGKPPEVLRNIFQVMEVRLLAKALRIRRIDWRGGGISIRFSKDNRISEEGIDYLLNPGKKIRFTSEFSLEISTDIASWDHVFPILKEELSRLF